MEDLLRMFSCPVWYIRGHAMRVLKWDEHFHVDRESSLVPVWISLPRLPIHFFDKSALFAICSVVGCPLRIDSATASLKRPSLARVQVEIDLLKDRPDKAWIDVEGSNGFWQKLVYEKGPAKQNAKASGVSVIGTEHAPERLAPPATQKTSSSEKGLSDLSRQDHFPLVAPPTSAAKASMPTNALAPEIQVESTPEPTGETKPSDRTPQHYPSQEIDNPPKSVPRQPVIVCDHDPSTDDAVAVSDPATRLSRLCDDSVILRRSEFYTADPLSSQDEPIPISTRTEVFQQLCYFYNQLHHVEPPSNMAPRRRGRLPGSKRNYFATAKTVKTSAFVWNVRGIGNLASIRRLKKLCRIHAISCIILLEPFIEAARITEIQSKLGFQYSFASDSNKIWFLCRNGITCSVVFQSSQLLHLKVEGFSSSPVYVTGVYAKSTRAARRVLWVDLLCLQQQIGNASWMVGGDFNVIARLTECVGAAHPDLGSMADFVEFLQFVLQELPTTDGWFTWVGVRSRGRMWKKLDRILFNSSWLQQFPSSTVELLNRATSDHSPMLYNCATSTSVPSSFKFQNMWIRHPTFQSTVAASWEMPQEGYGMYRFSRKLRRLKEVLKHWNKDVFGNVFDRVRQAEATVKSLEQIFDSTQADVDLVNLKSSQANLF
ncbi:hypothetical protein K2173_021646 [Erythroxylum novogranatense]|uniref:Endonuclease/exonuclease/phosphatase domain-containing protein n=1 Tax=Erythroxylum novogranatense TaxID=1862640 RepID=A0AAV8TJ35_9ROSI|nr:hypothetical protein K2173_021646 [Erythroxylum novogranatense]